MVLDLVFVVDFLFAFLVLSLHVFIAAVLAFLSALLIAWVDLRWQVL